MFDAASGAAAHETSALTSTRLDAILAEVAHLLPEQAPLHAFVHHNPLHAFEHLPFEQAVLEAARTLGREPYQSEEAFASHLAAGRILTADIAAVVAADCGGASTDTPICALPRREFIIGRLLHLFTVPRGPALDWLLAETRALTRFHPMVDEQRQVQLRRHAAMAAGTADATIAEVRLLGEWWRHLAASAPFVDQPRRDVRPRDRILTEYGVDTDTWVHPHLIRLCSAFLDQGVAYWQMPQREHGFLAAFRSLYGLAVGPPDRWMRGLADECRRQQQLAWSAAQTIDWALGELGIAAAEWEPAIRDTLLSLRGWAGMMGQFEHHPGRAPVAAIPARLADFLAVQLTLDAFAARHARRTATPARADSTAAGQRDLAAVYEAFVAAQILPVDPALLTTPGGAAEWLTAVRALDALERRRLLHLAFERHYQTGVLDGLLAHQRLATVPASPPRFQAVFCIDERAESMRRHLEESCPDAETLGYAGHFGVAMAYQGLDDIRPRPLCPVAIKPRHLVREQALESAGEESYRAARRRRGSARHALLIGSRSLARGGLLTAATGFLSVVPLILRCLFPRTAERWSHRFHHGRTRGPATRLAIERDEVNDTVTGGDLQPGYTVPEMAEVVATLLRTTGLARRCAPLLLIVGHGSSSLNNPHEAAYDCGATGGGRGGPNARAFAAMANHPDVRRALADAGIAIPAGTWFVGAFHNTCDDSVTYFDTDLLPPQARARFGEACRAIDVARSLDAHERGRRFASNPPHLDVDSALARAEARAVDLAQPRPECGHATNAACIVGRRARSRGLYLDRRAFLVSYDPTEDADGTALAATLLAVGPVGAGINLEYYFSYVDPAGYGCGTKLPHNITGLIGVMDGHASDLRTGLPWQMVEIHEPVRLLLIVEAHPETLVRILAAHPELEQLVRNRWIHLVSWNPERPEFQVYERGAFTPYTPSHDQIRVVSRSTEVYAGRSEHLGCAHVTAALAGGAA